MGDAVDSNQLSSVAQLCLTDFPGGSDGTVSVYNAGDPGSSPGLGRSPGEGNGNPLQYYCLAPVYEVAKSRTRLRDFTSHMTYYSFLCP